MPAMTRSQVAMTRSQIVSHPAATDIEYRITRHQSFKRASGEQMDEQMIADGDPYPVVEMYHRDYSGELKRLARFTMEQFVDLSRDVVLVGKELCPKVDEPD